MKKRYLVEINHNDYYLCTSCKDELQKQKNEGLVEQFRVKVVKNVSSEKCYSCKE